MGVDSKDSVGKMTHEICKQITSMQSNTLVLETHVLHHGQSLAENPMDRYGPPKGGKPKEIPIRKGRDGNFYPYYFSDPDYISRFELDFLGCFKCGSNTGHMNKDDCPLVRKCDNAVLQRFYR